MSMHNGCKTFWLTKVSAPKRIWASERMNAKIRQAQMMKVPYMLVVGEREVNDGTAALRQRDGQRKNNVSIAAFIEDIQEKIERAVSRTLGFSSWWAVLP